MTTTSRTLHFTTRQNLQFLNQNQLISFSFEFYLTKFLHALSENNSFALCITLFFIKQKQLPHTVTTLLRLQEFIIALSPRKLRKYIIVWPVKSELLKIYNNFQTNLDVAYCIKSTHFIQITKKKKIQFMLLYLNWKMITKFFSQKTWLFWNLIKDLKIYISHFCLYSGHERH